MHIPLSPRLAACARYVGSSSRVADIGCDHGYLGLHLLKTGQASHVYAADINDGPLQSAMRNAEKFGFRDNMDFFLSDGLRNVPKDFDVLICAGMGADTVISILEAAPWLRSDQYRMVLQCQTKTPLLRKYLAEHGWHIPQEAVLRDGKFLYTVMEVIYCPQHLRPTVGQWYFPPALLISTGPETLEYYRYVLQGLRIATAHKTDAEKRQALKELEALALDENFDVLRKDSDMVTVADVLSFIQTDLAPTYMKEDWDHVGLNCGRMDAPVSKILVALDPFEAIDEAVQMGADLLVTHHALLWKPDFITDQDAQGRRTLKLIENRIAHINAHTNLDLAPGGVNDVLAQALGLEDIQVVKPVGEDGNGRPYGLLRCGSVADGCDMEAFLARVKNSLGCDGLRYAMAHDRIHRVAVGGGACAGAMLDAKQAGCDTFVTADVRYNQFRDAHDLGLNLIDAGHFHTEQPVCAMLASVLRERFPEIAVKVSEKQQDVMKFY